MGEAASHEPGGEPDDEPDHETGAPHPRLRPFVESYVGYRTAGITPGVHAGLPSGSLTMIVAFDQRLDVTSGQSGTRDRYWGMIAGLHSSAALVHHDGYQHGVQLGITPRGATALFGISPGEVAERIEHLDDVVPAFAHELTDRLSAAGSWRARWAVLDNLFLRVLRLDQALAPELERSWAALVAGRGNISVAELAEHAGWSRRHFTKMFGDRYGLTPKVMARILRFERAQKMLRLPTRPSLASVAAACGYADQAHMTREWTKFAGSAPTAWMHDEMLPFTHQPDLTIT